MRLSVSARTLLLVLITVILSGTAFGGNTMKIDPTERAWVVAHRGASKQAPENTLPAFELAWKQGADAIEGDFHLTKDGQVVCIHDATTKRTTDKALVVADSTLSELRELDAGAWRGPKFTGTRIPTLAEVLSMIPPGKKIYIEIKCGPEIIPGLLAEFEKSGLGDEQILVISFQQTVLKALKAVVPHYETSWLVGFKTDKAGEVSPAYDAVLETLSEIKADGLSSGKNLADAGFISRLAAKGIEHHVWTVDNGKTAQRFQRMGTKSITTNVPAEILAAISLHPVPKAPSPD